MNPAQRQHGIHVREALAARRTLIALKHELTGTEAALLKP